MQRVYWEDEQRGVSDSSAYYASTINLFYKQDCKYTSSKISWELIKIWCETWSIDRVLYLEKGMVKIYTRNQSQILVSFE